MMSRPGVFVPKSDLSLRQHPSKNVVAANVVVKQRCCSMQTDQPVTEHGNGFVNFLDITG